MRTWAVLIFCLAGIARADDYENSEITSGHFDGVALGKFSGVTISSPYDGDERLTVEWWDTRNNQISVSVKAPNMATSR